MNEAGMSDLTWVQNMKSFFSVFAVILIMFIPLIGCAADEGHLISFHNGEAAGFMDMSGNTVVEAQYQAADQFHEGLAAVRSENLWGYIDSSGAKVIDHQYQIAMGFNKFGISRVKTPSGHWGAIDKTGREIIPAKYEMLTKFENDRAFIQENGLFGVITSKGAVTTPPKFENVDLSIFTSLVRFKSGDFWGYFDPDNGREVIPAKYIRAGPFYEGLARVATIEEGVDPSMSVFMPDQQKIGFVDENGKETIPLIHDFSTPKIQTGPIKKVVKDKQISFFNRHGEKLCEIQDGFYASEFVAGHAQYRSNKRPLRFGYIDESCEVVLDLEYEDLSDYGDIITFEKNGKSGFMDKSFEVLKTFPYDWVREPDNFGFMTFSKRSREGIMNSDYEVILKPKYEFIYSFRAGVTIAFDEPGNIFLVNEKGETVAGPIKKDHTPIWGDVFISISFCGKRYAINSNTGEPIGFTWKEYSSCKE